MGLLDSKVWFVTQVLAAVPLVYSGPYPRTTSSYYDPNGFFQFADKTHHRFYNFYQHVTEAARAEKLISNNEVWPSDKSISQMASGSFSYREEDDYGPSNWGALNATCEGMYQSPINLIANRSVIVQQKRALELKGSRNVPMAMVVENEGGAAAFFPEFRTNEQPRLRGGPLRGEYLFYQFHYHLGSEHTFDKKRYSAEMHLVFYNELYGSFKAARDQANGVAVIALTFDVLKSRRINSLNKWTRSLAEVVEAESEYSIPRQELFSVSDVLGDMEWPYFAYEGSLTTPPCSETVQWIVASERQLLTRSELKTMRMLKGRGGDWVQTARPTQALNFRRVFIY
ncbi:AAEL010886-PA [Aedes aegypti]|uniref:Alpha-carbonic anhydrase domain-containing protein n=2 Tax=Aedes aegypti TaxID=7159 RepID=Q16RN9_AEDAE|nr:carbonic anhydrase 13 [Aedes aegypti]XP_021713283.1 carbonic anhydrase 13-like [Aedes aegypti]EAT37073.1 AAEL010886-PA [Aedes aegypti]